MDVEDCWTYEGSYTIYLMSGADTKRVPRGADVRDTEVRVKAGRAVKGELGIDFYVDGYPFGWNYRFVRYVRDGEGHILWQNPRL